MTKQSRIPSWLVKVLPHGLVSKAATVYGPGTLGRGVRDEHGWLVKVTGGNNVGAAYSASATAYACIRRMAQDAAGVPLKFMNSPEADAKEVGKSDPIRALFMKPGEYMSASRLIEWSMMWMALRGEFFWDFDDPRKPTQILPFYDPLDWKHDVRSGAVIWEYQRGGNGWTRAQGDLLHYADVNPNDAIRGLSPLQAASWALDIDVYGDKLNAESIARGGDRGMVYQNEDTLDDDRYEQIISRLQARRGGQGSPSRDYILDGGLSLVNPALTKGDLDILALAKPSQKKICAVYGMAPVLIGDDDSAQYKSAPEAIKMYWRQTLVPRLHAIESSIDRFGERRGWRTYVRFDLSAVPALQVDEFEKARVALIHSRMGVPMVAINQRLDLGYDDATMQAADEAAAARAQAQADAFAMADTAPADEPAPPKAYTPPHLKGLTNATIKARARDPRATIERQRRLGKLERSTANKVRQVAGEYKDKAVKLAREVMTGAAPRAEASELTRRLFDLSAPLGKDLVDAVTPAHREAAADGVASIQELIDGKAIAFDLRRKAVTFTPDTAAVIDKRQRYIRTSLPENLFSRMSERILEEVGAAVEAGEAFNVAEQAIRDLMNGLGNNALTIARTEVGTLYNTARFDEMGVQGFASHEWVTSLDDATRESHAAVDGDVVRIGEAFSNGLAYPNQDSAPPEEVINCRCETIPVVED